jgi:hypothetical protein
MSIFSINLFSQVYDTGDEVGIGVSNPEKKLDVLGPMRLRGDYSTLYFYRSTNPDDIAKIRYEEPNQKFIIGVNNKDLIFSSKINFGTSMKISNTGDLTLYGSANFNGSLSLTGDIQANSIETSSYITAGGASRIKGDFATLYFQRATNTADIAKIRYEESNQKFIIGANNKDIVFSSKLDFGESMRITSQGHIGIGTTNPGSYRLAVEGVIGAREVKVTLDSWSDFVFQEDYLLIELEAVEKFIDKEDRLPDIPSEREIIENGLNLGEMDAKLLQKIEELTLYMIQMNKDVKVLKEENSELKKKIVKLEAVQ